jgi:SAM-dependent methyltransferase
LNLFFKEFSSKLLSHIENSEVKLNMRFFVPRYIALMMANLRYTSYLKEHGATARGAHWLSVDTQKSRFQELCKLLTKDNCSSETTINDFGCGYGALWEYLQELNFQGSYTGYDINHSMIAAANNKYYSRNVNFVQANTVTNPAMFTLISGTFNLKMHASDRSWWKYTKQLIQTAWNNSEVGMAFNILEESLKVYPMEILFYSQKSDVIDFCKTLTPYVEWKLHEELGDLIVYMKRI